MVSFVITVWTFQDLSVTQNFREINFGESISSETDIFATFGALNFVHSMNISLPKSAKIHKDQTSEFPNVLKWQILHFWKPHNCFHVKSVSHDYHDISTL